MKVIFSPLCLLIIMGLLISPLRSTADTSNSQYASRLVSLKKTIEATKTGQLDEVSKLKRLNLYFETEDYLEELVALQLKIQVAQNQLKGLPDDIKQFEKKISKFSLQTKDNKDTLFSQYSNDELEQRQTDDNISLQQLNASISRLEIQLTEQQKRPKQIREQLAQIKVSKATVNQKKTKLATQKKNKKELTAHKNLIDSHLSKLDMSRAWLELEKTVTPLRIQAQKLELELLHLQEEQLSNQIKTLEDFQSEKREKELGKAQAELIQAQKQAANKPPVIRKEILENFRYNKLLLEVTNDKGQYREQKNEVDRQYARLEKDFRSAEKKINLAGLSPALGNLLREQRRNLPLTKSYQDKFNSIQSEIALVSLEIFELEEAEKALADIDNAAQSRIEESSSTKVDKKEESKNQTELKTLLKDQKHLISQLGSEYPKYARTLADVDFSLHQLVNLGEKYKHFLDQRLLWVPSAPTIDRHFIPDLIDSLLWFTKASHWQEFAEDIKISLQSSPFLAFIGLVILSFQLYFRSHIKAKYEALLKKSSKIYSDQFVFTFYGLGYSFLLILPVAILTAWLGWLLLIHNQTAPFTQAIANGLLAVSIPLLILSFFHQLFRADGFVKTLFNWEDHHVELMFKLLNLLQWVIVPVVFISGMFAYESFPQHSQTLGRMALIMGMCGVFYLLHRLAHPGNGLANDFYLAKPAHWITKLRYIWYGLLVIMPIIVIGFAVAGYYQSAIELQSKLIILIRLIFFSGLLHEVVMRWLVLANRQLALQNVRQKRKQLEQEKENEDLGINLEEDALFDIPKINEQSTKILRVLVATLLVVGIWLTLRDILPALAIFDKVELWQHMTLVDGKETAQAITLVNVFAVILYLILVLVFVKNFPGLLDLVFAGRYTLSTGGRYALVQLTRYGVITLTIIAIANQLGGSWSQVQWLVAALSVGLGFGLQEIFANLVSGIILLFERPVRVGDTVTIGEVDGRVSRIQMRATTIIDWNQKELIVPNKSFITEKLVNWTLTDTTTRLVIPIGVAYDSDIDQVQSILEQVVAENPMILKDPSPTVYFLEFGDSSLNFSIRVFVRHPEERLSVTSDLHKKIKNAFDALKIEIPFPQQDIYIRSNPPL